jgi:hypothetical protein
MREFLSNAIDVTSMGTERYCLLPLKHRTSQGKTSRQRSSISFFSGQGVVSPPPQSRAMFQAWREVSKKKSVVSALQGIKDSTTISSKEEGKHQAQEVVTANYEFQLKKGVEAHLGMPPLSPFSVNFNFLQSFTHNFLDLNKLKNFPSLPYAMEIPAFFSPGPPLSSLSFGRPPSPPEHPPFSQSQDSSLISDEESICYNLRFHSIPSTNRLIPPPSGLGLNPSQVSTHKGRGRKYFFSKAQSRAAIDVAVGRQLSISGALRAIPTPEGSPK